MTIANTFGKFTGRIIVICFVISQFGCQQSTKKQAVEPYQPTWESLKQYEVPEWFRDAKFGIYFHWGPYSVPAYGYEWYSHWMYVEDHPIRKYHEETYGPVNEFGYKDLIPLFTAEKFNPDEWAELFQKAGARFAGPVAEHADGFAMWDSEVTRWNAADMGPKRDIVGELSEAIRERDMKFVSTFHHSWKYAWYPTWDESTDASDPAYADLYGPKVPDDAFIMPRYPQKYQPEKPFNDNWLARLKEVVDNYKPDLIYFDNKLVLLPEEYRIEFLTHYYNQALKNNQEVVCTYKYEDLAKGSAVLDVERGRMKDIQPFAWMTDDSVDWDSWSHISNPNYKSVSRLIDFLIDVVSKNGCVLLNITPKANGEIPEPVKERLLEIGKWLQIHGEAIYGTRPWKVFGEGTAEFVEGHMRERENPDNTEKDIRFTTKGDYLYAFVLASPTEPVHIKSLNSSSSQVKKITLLGSKEKIKWNQTEEALIIEVPQNMPSEHAIAFRISLDA